MKTSARRCLIVFVEALLLMHILPYPATAQTFKVLHAFAGVSDGSNPQGVLILSGNTLYGTTVGGTAFAVKTDGTGFTNLHNVGSQVQAGLVLSGDTLYGTARLGGSAGNGTVFSVKTNGTAFTNLYSFSSYTTNSAGGYPPYTNSDGVEPTAGLLLVGSTLYGTTSQGGTLAFGTVFSINTDGTSFTNMYNFGYTNGAGPYNAALISSGNTLYGTAQLGGPWQNLPMLGLGSIFSITTDGSGFATLYSFTNGDGLHPEAPLTLSGSTLYGTAYDGGSSGAGTVYAINTNRSGFRTLYTFTGSSDGSLPEAGLVVSGNTLYGTTRVGGSANAGTIFQVSTDGTGFRTLYTFPAQSFEGATNSDGAEPKAGLVLSGSTLYGTAYYGGSHGRGTVFSLSIPPQLTITMAGDYVVLNWATNFTGYHVLCTTNLSPPVAWTTNSQAPIVVNGLNTVTNVVSCPQQFFRLSQ